MHGRVRRGPHLGLGVPAVLIRAAPTLLALGAATALLVRAPPAAACACMGQRAAEALARASVAFEGWAVEHVPEQPLPPCTAPAAPTPAAGCVEVVLWDLRGCALPADEVFMTGPDGRVVASTDDDQTLRSPGEMPGVSTSTVGHLRVCQGAVGNYAIRGSTSVVRLRASIPLGADAGAGRVIPLDTTRQWRTRFQVSTAYQGGVRAEAWVEYSTDAGAFGINEFELGEHDRVLGGLDSEGAGHFIEA